MKQTLKEKLQPYTGKEVKGVKEIKCKDCFYYELCKMTRCGNLYLKKCNAYVSRIDVYKGVIPVSEVIPF